MDAERERAEQGLVALLNKALRQVPFVRLDCVDEVTGMFAECLSYMESHLELGDSDEEGASEEDEQLRTAAEHKLSSRATSADRRTRDEPSTAAPAPALTLPAAPAADTRARLGLGGSSAAAASTPAAAAGPDKPPVLPPAGLATKLIGSTVTRDYSSPSQSKRSLGGGVGSKRGSITLTTPVSLSGGGGSVSPVSGSGVSPTASGGAAAPTLPPSGSLTASTSSSSSGGVVGSGTSPSSKLGLGLGLKGSGGLTAGSAAGQTQPSSAPASTASTSQPPAQPSNSNLAGAGGGAAGTGGAGAPPKQIGLGHRPSSRAQYNAAAAAQSTDEEEAKEGASGGSGPSSGQNSDTDEEVIRVARPLGGAPKNKLLHRAVAGLGSREYPSPKLGGRSLGASPAGMGPRGMSAPNNQQQQLQAGAGAGQQQQQAQPPQPSGHSQRAPSLSHAASTGSTPDTFLTQPPSLSSPPSLGPSSSAASDVDVLPEPSSSLREDDSGGGLDDAAGGGSAAGGGLILTEAVQFVKEKQLSDKEALNIPEGGEAEEKDLVDEALERRPDPLQKLRNEVVVAVTASPKQIRSSLRLLTLAAESANSADGTVTPPEAEPPASNGAAVLPSAGADLSSHRLNPLLSAASMPLAAALHAASPSQSASNTPKPAFLRRLDSPESHHGQLIAAKAKLQMMINRAMQTIPQIKKDALPAVHAKLEAALAKLEASAIQP